MPMWLGFAFGFRKLSSDSPAGTRRGQAMPDPSPIR